MDQYNKGLIAPDVLKEVDGLKAKVISGEIVVPNYFDLKPGQKEMGTPPMATPPSRRRRSQIDRLRPRAPRRSARGLSRAQEAASMTAVSLVVACANIVKTLRRLRRHPRRLARDPAAARSTRWSARTAPASRP